VRLRSLAKINLDLRVLHKRPDGFHDLRTIFQTISVADTIEIEYQRGRTSISLKSNLEIPGNLVLQAADSVLKAARATGRLEFNLIKRIPLGGGLGGGSSNAAAILLALPALLRKSIPLEKLMELAADLGSDVPFFLIGGTAVGLGRGTELYPLPDVPAWPGLLITPRIHSYTAAAYAALNRPALTDIPPPSLTKFQAVAWNIASIQPSAVPVPAPDWTNDFETVVFNRHPELKSIQKKLLTLGAWRAMMTGSGSALFGLFANRASRDSAARWFRKEPSEYAGKFAHNQVYPFTMVSRARYHALWWRQLAVATGNRTWPPQDRYAE
ncbi:MAG: 4-(cytidine 5'-diphospho)-2-C-methyl-D-erythritol kinase, partial [Bryobacterales bacterium]|nr:4-(cytidine 5'-diphospho)-2-C-methyl-D-erythritol kinase [Bryobacterales bacterium]